MPSAIDVARAPLRIRSASVGSQRPRKRRRFFLLVGADCACAPPSIKKRSQCPTTIRMPPVARNGLASEIWRGRCALSAPEKPRCGRPERTQIDGFALGTTLRWGLFNRAECPDISAAGCPGQAGRSVAKGRAPRGRTLSGRERSASTRHLPGATVVNVWRHPKKGTSACCVELRHASNR